MERRPISVNLRKIKINDIKTVIFFTTFKEIYFKADNNIIIPQAYKGIPYRNTVHLTKLWAFKDGKKAHLTSFDQVMGF